METKVNIRTVRIKSCDGFNKNRVNIKNTDKVFLQIKTNWGYSHINKIELGPKVLLDTTLSQINTSTK